VTEYKFFEGDTAYVSTFDFHKDRERAPHLEQFVHRHRMELAAEYVRKAVSKLPIGSGVSDLGCGDGGLLQLLGPDINAWGYDFQPSNEQGWHERGVDAQQADVFGKDWDRIVTLGSVVVMTEVLEHLTDPHGVLAKIYAYPAPQVKFLVCSSPNGETPESHDGCHAWGWDVVGYSNLIRGAGFEIVNHQLAGPFQVVLARRSE
jgi:2-polyprenyl-3-methyl-5-hydroxy-6-metoxy-1,4-benzoquinol methylase